MFRLLPGLLILLFPVAAGPVVAAELTTYGSAGVWLEALPGSPTFEGFD